MPVALNEILAPKTLLVQTRDKQSFEFDPAT